MLIDPRTFRRLVEARAVLVDGAYDDLTVRDVAARVGISPYAMIRRFEALFGATPHRLRTAARLARARERLTAGASVTETCMAVGFSSLGSFSALFTRWVGTSPTRYRQVVRASIEPPSLVPGCLGMLGCTPRNSREAGVG